MPSLSELQAHFVRYETKDEPVQIVAGDQATWRERGCPTETVIRPVERTIPVQSFGDAQGLWFLCPKCWMANGNSDVKTHWCDTTFAGRGALDSQGTHGKDGKPVRWNPTGTGIGDLSLTPSVLIEGGCGWHGFITNGIAA